MTESALASLVKLILTFSALNTYRGCPRKYKHRFIDFLQPRERAEALGFGSIIHGAIELWYRSVDVARREKYVRERNGGCRGTVRYLRSARSIDNANVTQRAGRENSERKKPTL